MDISESGETACGITECPASSTDFFCQISLLAASKG